jgi:hypothetical protein
LVIGGIAGADSLKSVDGSASAISMAFFKMLELLTIRVVLKWSLVVSRAQIR